MRILDNGIYRDMTQEEIANREVQAKQDEVAYWKSIPYDEAVNEKIRERYSESQEFAILRQKDEKSEEYAKYYSYCEECKAFVKSKKAVIE